MESDRRKNRLGLRNWVRKRRIGRDIHRMMSWWRLSTSRFAHPRLIDVPPGRRILTLSPHPDDDVIGVGGTLVKHHLAGCRLVTLVLTDGSAGAPGQKRADVVRIRRQEEQASAKHLGIDQVIFWEEQDGALASNSIIADRLRSFLCEMQPDLVYVPFFLDTHPDHQTVTPILARALQGTDLNFTLGMYETNTPLLPNRLVDISKEMETKLKAVGEHRSQLEYLDYVDTVRALGRWRSGAFSRSVEFVEAFYIDDVHEYIALWRQVSQV